MGAGFIIALICGAIGLAGGGLLAWYFPVWVLGLIWVALMVGIVGLQIWAQAQPGLEGLGAVAILFLFLVPILVGSVFTGLGVWAWRSGHNRS
jgi:hypothetical protein